MKLNNLLHNRKPEAESYPSAALHLNTRDTIITLPEPLLFRFRQSRSMIPHPDPCQRPFGVYSNLDGLIRRRILQCIGQIVRNDLLDAVSIRMHPHRLVELRQA